MKPILIVLIIAISFISCNKARKPENIYPIDKMAAVFSDIMMAEKEILHSQMRLDTAIAFYHYKKWPEICEKHHIDSSQFQKSFEYYIKHIDKNENFKTIFEKTIIYIGAKPVEEKKPTPEKEDEKSK